MPPLSRRMAECCRWGGPVSYGIFELGAIAVANGRTKAAAEATIAKCSPLEQALADLQPYVDNAVAST